MKTFIALIMSMLVLAGCASNAMAPRCMPVNIVSEPVDRPILSLPPKPVYNARKFNHHVKLFDSEWNECDESNVYSNCTAYWILDADGYEKMSLNSTDILNVISRQRKIIEAYEEYYHSFQK